MMGRNKRTGIECLYKAFITATTLFTASNSFAQNDKPGIHEFPWRAIISLSSGVAISSDFGKSQTFPIVNPITDEFFIYSAKQSTQTVGVLDGFVGAEWAFQPNWDLQMGLGYNQAWNFKTQGSLLQGADAQSADQYSYKYKGLTRQLLAEGKLLYRFKERYLPYALLGLGAAFNDANSYHTNAPPFLTFTRQYKNNTQTSFAYALGMGIDVVILDHLRLGVGYRFADFGQISLGNATIDTTKVRGTLSQTHLYANQILAQITWVI
jgi:opacity protein-like surface antigen